MIASSGGRLVMAASSGGVVVFRSTLVDNSLPLGSVECGV